MQPSLLLSISNADLRGQGSTGQQVPDTCMLAPSEAFFFQCRDFFQNVAVGWNGSLVRQKGYWLLWFSSLNKKNCELCQNFCVYLSLWLLCSASAGSKCHCCPSRHGQGGSGDGLRNKTLRHTDGHCRLFCSMLFSHFGLSVFIKNKYVTHLKRSRLYIDIAYFQI